MGGLGKTTLAQLVYDDNRVKEHFNLKAWVCVSNEFDVLKITKRILENLGSSTTGGDRNDPNCLQVALKENIMGKKYLIVLDDVWNENPLVWEALTKPVDLIFSVKAKQSLLFDLCDHLQPVFFHCKAEKMAEIATLFLSPFLQAFFKKVASREFVDFFRRRKLDDGLLEKMNIALLSVNGVLEDAEKKQVTSPHVKIWLDKLKDVVYEAEDVLDEIETEALRSKLDAENQTTASKVHKSISTSLHPFAKEIEPKIKKVLAILDDLIKQKEVIGLKEGIGEKSSERLPTTSLFDESSIFGRIDDKEAIIKSLLLDEESVGGLCVITIVGMGGLGKTTLAQLVYDDNRVKEHFEHKAWVCVSNEFDVRKITKTILEKVGSSTPGDDRKDLDCLQASLKENIMGKKFLIVLDDVWNDNYVDWEVLTNPFRYGAQGSKIIATTRGIHVASVMRSTITYPLKQLPEEDCWSLFAKHAFRDDELGAYPELEAIGREIVKKCDGLPLAAKTIGSLLWSKLDINEWDKILKSELWDLQTDQVIPALWLSYQYLPSHLKPCFAYCSIFPQDHLIDKEELILLWMAQGFLQQSKDMTLEQVGDNYFGDLVARSLIQQCSNEFLRSISLMSIHFNEEMGFRFPQISATKFLFVMHDLVNDLARLVSRPFIFRLEGENYDEIENNAHHFSIYKKSFDDVKKFEMLYKAKGLRTFLPLNDYLEEKQILTKELTHDLLPTLRCLRVLSLSHYENVTELPDSISKIQHLRYLDLSHTSIRKLPDSLCKLCNLQTLKLSFCSSLSVLPREIYRLVNLRHLVFYESPIKEMPVELGRLRHLQTLTEFIVSKHVGSSVGVLRKLANLRVRLCISGLENVVYAADALDASLKNRKYLEKLLLKWKADSNVAESHSMDVLESLQPHTNLKELTIEYYSGRRFPDWVGQSSFTKITSLALSHCTYCCVLPPIWQLPALEYLEIAHFNGIVTVGPEFYGSGCSSIQPFGALKYLWFIDMPGWEKWMSCFGAENEDGAFFTNLEQLWIENCPKLTGALPIHLPSLDRLHIINCPRLVASLPTAPGLTKLELSNSEGVPLSELPAGMQELKIDGYDALESLPEGIIDSNGCLLSDLKNLDISNCDSLGSLPLNMLSKLRSIWITKLRNLESFEQQQEHDLLAWWIHIKDCPNFVSFPNEGLRATNLRFFDILNCTSLRSLPEKMHILLPSLRDLQIRDCPEIESFPEGGLPPTLISISVINCDKLVASRMGWGLENLPSLAKLEIGGKSEDVKSFPEAMLLPNSLESLTISYFPSMKSLDNNGLRHLTSLRSLDIFCCPKFKFLPEEGLPASLRYLEINGCPLLEKQLKKKKGKEWSTHLHCIKINGEVI